MRSKPFAIVIIVLVLAALACNLPGSETPDPHAISTNVAATLTALAGGPIGGGPGETGTPTLTPDVAESTDTPTATATIPAPPHLRVVYVLGGNVYIKDAAAAPAQITFAGNAEDVRISDDGQKVAYTRRDVAEAPASLGVVNSDGLGDSIVVTGAQINALYPLGDALYHDISDLKFIPGTHHLLMNTREAFMGPGLQKNNDVLMADLDAGTFVTLLAPPNGGDFYPSPDGTKMAIVRPDSVSLANIDGSGYTANIISFTFILTYSEYAYYPPVVWQSDSSQAGVIIPSAESLPPTGPSAIWRINPAAGTASAVASISGQFMFPHAILSPDLLHYSYSVPITDATSALYVANTADASSLHLADGGNQSVVSFSPDGSWFIYNMGGPTTYYIGSLGGGTALIGPRVIDPIWINATHFVYLFRNTGVWSINLGGSDGSSTVLASGAGEMFAFDADE